MLAWLSWHPSLGTSGAFAIGWMAGWIGFWRARPLPPSKIVGGDRPAVAVVVPARDEEEAIARAIGGLRLGPGDELVVVDDHSSDATAARAVAAGARIVEAPPVPEGWTGKPNACWAGVAATTAPVLVFLDADVRPPADLVDRLVARVVADPTALVSVQPWHTPGSWAEHASLPFNVVALLGSGGFAVVGREAVHGGLAFGPVLACTRSAYLAAGGHALESVRAAVAEDIALGRAFAGVEVFTGAPDIAFRMFPGGLVGVVAGWTKHLAVGAVRAPWWAAILGVAWVWSQLAGWAASPWLWLAATLQLAVLGRRAGRFSVVAIVLGPVLMLGFVAVFARAAVLGATGRPVGWKGRRVRMG